MRFNKTDNMTSGGLAHPPYSGVFGIISIKWRCPERGCKGISPVENFVPFAFLFQPENYECATIPSLKKGTTMNKNSAAQTGNEQQLSKEELKQRAMHRFSHIGIACPLAWGFVCNGVHGEQLGASVSWQIAYLTLSVAMVLGGAYASKHMSFLTSRAASITTAGLGAISCVLLYLAFNIAILAPMQLIASISCACILGWLYLQWGVFYAGIELRYAVGCLLLGNIGGSVLKSVLHFCPLTIQCAVAMMLPAASVFLCWKSLGDKPLAVAPTIRFESHNLKSLWRMCVAVAVFSFITAFLIGRFAGNQSSVAAMDFLASRLVEITISIIVLVVVLKFNKSFSFSQLWRISLLVLALDMLFQAAIPQVTLMRCMESSAWDLIVLFTWLTITDVARHAKISAPIVFGGGWACYAAPFALGSAMASAAPQGYMNTATLVALMFALLLTSTFCLDLRDQNTKWIFAELSGEPSKEPSDYASIADRCASIAKQRGLTPRELEIMQLLCKGRTKAFIAETLYLTENTVKGHTKHIYTKLEVHSKQELMDLVERQHS